MPKRKRVDFFEEHFEDFSVPIPWDCFVAVLKRRGFDMKNSPGGGVGRLFKCGSVKFTVHEPHGKEEVTKFARERAIEAIERLRGENS